MANYYLDFDGLNTFIYEPVGYDPSNQVINTGIESSERVTNGDSIIYVNQNHIGGLLFNVAPFNIPVSIEYSKNYLFSHELPTTASFFPALMIHRNGPYGFPTWKQIRVGDNPLTRKQKKENVFTFVREPGEEFTYKMAGKIETLRSKYGAIEAYKEMPVISKYKPVELTAETDGGRIKILSVMGNGVVGFDNDEVNRYYKIDRQESDEFYNLKRTYLNGGLQSDKTPINSFERLMYSETIFPQKLYTYKKYKRQRTTFSFPWRNNRDNRTPDEKVSNGLNATVSQSIWPMDVTTGWNLIPTSAPRLGGTIAQSFGLGLGSATKPGILFNRYSSFVEDMYSVKALGSLDVQLSPAPIYARRHMLTPLTSAVAPSGMLIEGVNYGTTFNDLSVDHIPSGEAAWEAPSQSNNAPFYDSYDLYFENLKGRYKSYSILPEFRISNHVNTYQTLGDTEENLNLFELTGGLENTTGSAEDNFYKIFTNSDFMEHFEFIHGEHEEFVDPTAISIKCKAVKKFLPYDGLYPQQRTVDIAQQFYQSYSGSFAMSGSDTFWGASTEPAIGAQNILTPLFAPGVLFNSIKSGVAVDFPIMTGSAMTSGSADSDTDKIFHDTADYEDTDSYLLKLRYDGMSEYNSFDRRIPFRALYEPERFLAGYNIASIEPHPSGNFSGSVTWDGTGDNLYKLMIHNFLAEVPEFFMQNKSFATISSKKSSDPEVGNARSGRTYMMRVKMYKSMVSASFAATGSSDQLEVPQITGSNTENFTMYSRPSAFGPPSVFYEEGVGGVSISPQDSRDGYNFPFTPPYYHGQGWADIKFVADDGARKYSINEIINKSTVEYYRWVDPEATRGRSPVYGGKSQIGDPANDAFLQLSASLNLFGKASVKQIGQGADQQTIVASTLENDDQQWVIMPRFETPMLNFNHLSASTSVTLPLNGSQSVPRGMWHQYGRIEEDPQKGIFMQITDVPNKHIEQVLGGEPTRYVDGVGEFNTTGSLMELCGFDSNPVKMGNIATTKRISEAVVAVPFIEEEGRRMFFNLDRDEVTVAEIIARGKNPNVYKTQTGTDDPSDSVQRMVNKMRDYVFPPPMDFFNNRDIEPFAMYIFEFHHNLTKQDLANIWQGLMPKIGTTHEDAVSTFSHPLLTRELLGQDNQLPDKLRWMVFKVKKRAQTNYYTKILERTKGAAGQIGVLDDEFRENLENALGSTSLKSGVSYNWPYDFFSLVELAQIDASVSFKPDEPLTESPGELTQPDLPVSQPPAEDPVNTSSTMNNRVITKQTYVDVGGVPPFTRTFYHDGVQTTTEEEPGDTRIELRRTYFSAANITVIDYKYDSKTTTLSGDQT